MLNFWWSNSGSNRLIHGTIKMFFVMIKQREVWGFRCPRILNEALLLKQVWLMYFTHTSILLAGAGSWPSHAWRGYPQGETLASDMAGYF